MFPARLLMLSSISGMLSYLSVSLPHFFGNWFAISDGGLFFLPGLLFGMFVLAPLSRNAGCRIGRWIGLVVFSVCAWYVAVSVGFQVLPRIQSATIVSCGISGSVGVLLLALASRLLIPWRFDLASLLMALLAGFLGGCIFGLAVRMPRASLAGEALYLAGFIVWQPSVAISLFGRPNAAFEEKGG